MKKYLLLYNFFITLVLGVSTFTSARTPAEFGLAVLFLPFPLYFGNRLMKLALANARRLRYRPKLQFAADSAGTASLSVVKSGIPAVEGEIIDDARPIKDIDKRLFLRLVGSSGIALFMLAIFRKDAHAAFFGSVPGPGTVAIKDSQGNAIDPAEKQPTDGYEIAQLDDAGPNFAYYGFLNKTGNWYVMREDLVAAPGTYLYAAGLSNFGDNWTGRAGLIYTTFDLAF